MTTSPKTLTICALLALLANTAAFQTVDDRGEAPMTYATTLSNELIFEQRLYDAESPVASRWHPDGASFTVLEVNPAYEDAA